MTGVQTCALPISIVIVTLFVFSYAMYKVLTGSEYRDDYILAVNTAIASYQVLLIITFILQMLFGLGDGIMNFVQPLIILALAYGSMKFFGLKFSLKNFKYKKLVLVIFASLFFGILFYFLNEPVPGLFSAAIPVLLLYTLFVSLGEEFMFRFVVFRLAEKAFSYKKALHLQAIVFSLIHLVGIAYIFEHYSIQGSFFMGNPFLNIFVYFIALYLFSLVAGSFVGKSKKFSYTLIYAIVLHWVTNLVSILLRLFF